MKYQRNCSVLELFTVVPCAIITRGLYTFYPLFEVQKRFLRSFFLKILALCMVSIQERVMMARIRYVRRKHIVHTY